MTGPLVINADHELPARPLIGLSVYTEQARWGVWDRSCVLLPDDYVTAVVAAGGVPVLLPTSADALAGIRPLDGLILSGGPDLDSTLYGEPRHPLADQPQRDRDRWELELLAAAKHLGVPVLGICRGMQLLNVAHGGGLVQALEDSLGAELHRTASGAFGVHDVRVEADSWCGGALGTRASVPTYHHQAVSSIGRGFRAVAWSDDGCVEAIESVQGPMLVGVQWHPEADLATPLIERFVQDCSTSSYDGRTLAAQPIHHLETR